MISKSKYWVEQNNIKELDPLHIGYALWNRYNGKRKKIYELLMASLNEYGEIIVVHHKGAKHGIPQFVGESVIDKSCRGEIVGGYNELASVLREIFRKHGVDEKNINEYLKQVKNLLSRDRKDTHYFIIELKKHRRYSSPVYYSMVNGKIKYRPQQGRYLVPITLQDYRVISGAAGVKPITAYKPRHHQYLIDLSKFTRVVDDMYGIYRDDVLLSIVIGYNSGKHLLLAGPPGTGKSFLAEILAKTLNYDLVKTTASSTWTRYDFIGGPRIIGGSLRWNSGVFLRALYRHMVLMGKGRGAILLIDELNRCEADKVLSEFFTIYSSSDQSKWIIPDSILEELNSYNKLDDAGKYFLKVWKREGVVRIPWGFRIVATVNTWDITHLYTLGYALLRRFHIVEVDPPVECDVSKLVEQAKSVISSFSNIDDNKLRYIAESIERIARVFRENSYPFGIAYEIDAIVLAYNYSSSHPGGKLDEAVDYGLMYSLNNALHVEVSKYMLPRRVGEGLKKAVDTLKREKVLDKYPRLKKLLLGEAIGYTW